MLDYFYVGFLFGIVFVQVLEIFFALIEYFNERTWQIRDERKKINKE